jgi:NAD(P)-dependent dehydrogenase (short-subunit alcohol dehydrogenase family)
MSSLTGKTAIVAGGATLIGVGIARALALAGANIVIADIDESAGRAAVDATAGTSVFTQTDVGDDGQVTACVRNALGAFGSTDTLVNLACNYTDRGGESGQDEWWDSLRVNVVGAALLARAAHQHLGARRDGAIVNITSISGRVGQAGRWLYPASKAALTQLTRSMALDYAPDGIRVNSVWLGWTWSGVMNAATRGNRELIDRVAAPFNLLRRAGESFNTSVPIYEQLKAEFPEVQAVNAMYTHGLVNIISTKVRHGGFGRVVGLRALTTPHGIGYSKLVIVVDDTVDPFNLPQVMWALSTKFNPEFDAITIPRMYDIPLDPSGAPQGDHQSAHPRCDLSRSARCAGLERPNYHPLPRNCSMGKRP